MEAKRKRYCRHCGVRIRRTARHCPHCLKRTLPWTDYLAVSIIVVIVLILLKYLGVF